MKKRKRQSTQKTMSCRGCKQIFLGASGLQKHLKQSQRCRNKIKVLEQKQHAQQGKSVLNSRLRNAPVKHASKNMFKCKHPNCTRFFESLALMREHVQTHLSGSKTEDKSAVNTSPKKVFACSKCKSEFTSSARLHAHSIQCKRNGPCSTCNICGVMFLTQNALTQHFNKLHKVLKTPEPTKLNKSTGNVKTTVFTCYLCEESRTGWKEMLQHKEQCRNNQIEVKPNDKNGKTVVSFRCKLCDTYYNNFHTLRRHVKLDHVKDRFKCEKCQKQIFMLKNFQNHQGICKIDDQKTLDSSISTESVVSDIHDSNYDATTEATDSMSDITVNSSDDESPAKQIFECSFCTKKFQLQIALKQHLQIKHKSSLPSSKLNENFENCVESVSCEACENKFPPQIVLSHLKEQHDLALYRCRKCNFMTSSAQGVKVHIHMEHRGISFDKGFQAWNDHFPLKKANDRKFYCRFCVMGGYDGHQHWHEHMLQRHPHKLLSCPECAMKMPSVQAFVQHIMKKHYEASSMLLGSMYEPTRSQHDDNKITQEDEVVEAKDEKQESCQNCDFKTGNKYELEQHELQKHPKCLTCPNCHRTFKNLHWYSKHMAHCDEFKCDLCKFKCKEINVFEVHKLEKHKVKEAVVKAVLLSAEEMDEIMGKNKSENKHVAAESEKVSIKRKKKLKVTGTKDAAEVVEKKHTKEEKRTKVVKHVRKKSYRILSELMTTTDDDTDNSSKRGRKRKQEKPLLRKKMNKKEEKVMFPTAGVSDKTTALNEEENGEKSQETVNKEEDQGRVDEAVVEQSSEKVPTVEDWVVNSTNTMPQENTTVPPLPMIQTEHSDLKNIEEKSSEILNDNRPNIFSVFSGSGETWDSSDAELPCEVCGKVYQRENHLINHKRFKHKDVYTKEKIARDAYKQYLINKKNDKLSLRRQKLAEQIKKDKARRAKRMKKEKGRRGRPVGSKNLVKLTKRKISMFNKKPVSKYHCFKCDKSFWSYRGLAVHKGHMHVRTNNEFDKKPTANLLKSNMKVNQVSPKEKSVVKAGNDYNYKFKNACSLCSDSFQSTERLKKHKILVHSQYECEKCDNYFSNKSMFILHKRVHGRITYKCEDCSRVFQMEKAYIMHKQTHLTPIKPKQPPSIYEKIFKSGGEFPFYCEKCNLGYFWVSDLALHSTSGVCGLMPPFQPSQLSKINA